MRPLSTALLALLIPVMSEGHPAWGIAVDDRGRVIFSDVGMNAIWMIESDGSLKRLASNLHSHDLWLDRGANMLYGEHAYWIEAEQRFAAYRWRMRPGQPFERITEFPEHVRGVGAPDGTRYETDGKEIVRRFPDGRQELPGGAEFAALPRRADTIRGITVDDEGSLYVADFHYHCVWKVPPGGSAQRVMYSGRWWAPTGVAVRTKDLYVLEDRPYGWKGVLAFWESPRVVRIRTNGPQQVLMTIDFNRQYVVLGGGTLIVVGAFLAWAVVRRWQQRLVLR